MPRYYGIERSGEYLAHYGVKGMKWGVRKAIERGNTRAYNRHYRKALRKLNKLDARANVKTQEKIAKQNERVSKIAGRVGMAGIGAMATSVGANHAFVNAAKSTYLKKRMHADRYNEFATQMLGHYQKRALKALNADKSKTTADKLINQYNNFSDKHYGLYQDTNNKLKKQFDRQVAGAKVSKIAGRAGSIVGGVGLGISAGAAIKAHKARKLTTNEGHAKAVAERNAWKKEMDKTFTKKPDVKVKSKSAKRKPRKYFTKQDFKDAAKAAGLSMVMGPAANYYVQSKRIANEIPTNNNRHGKKRWR